MAQITAKQVAELRAKTGLGMMDCKKALVEADGDSEAAVRILREKGLAVAAKKQSRIASEGIVDIMTEGNVTAMVEVNSETDFVAKNAKFRDFVKSILSTIITNKPENLDALLNCTFSGSTQTVNEALVGMIAMIGEKLSIRRFVVVEGTVATYIHGNGVTGVIVKYDVDDSVKTSPEFLECAKNIALQIAAGSPPSYVCREQIPASVVEDELKIQVAAAKNDEKLANKPDEVIKKIVAGKLGKLFYERVCLLEQEYVKDGSFTVGKYIDSVSKQIGQPIKVDSFVIYEMGEGIEKREEDFAAEIEKMVKG